MSDKWASAKMCADYLLGDSGRIESFEEQCQDGWDPRLFVIYHAGNVKGLSGTPELVSNLAMDLPSYHASSYVVQFFDNASRPIRIRRFASQHEADSNFTSFIVSESRREPTQEELDNGLFLADKKGVAVTYYDDSPSFLEVELESLARYQAAKHKLENS